MTTSNHTILVLRENPRDAWNSSDQACLHILDPDFVADYRRELDDAAVDTMRTVLPQIWADTTVTGLSAPVRIELTDDDTYDSYRDRDRIVHSSLVWLMWDEATTRISGQQLLAAADLVDVYANYLKYLP